MDDLPRGARKYKGPLNRLLRALHVRHLGFYGRTRICISPETEVGILQEFGAFESGHIWHADEGKPTKESKRFFNGKLHPFVDGYQWYRGICIPIERNSYILLYVPWIAPQKTRPPVVYLLGDVPEEILERVIRTYCERLSRWIDEKDKEWRVKKRSIPQPSQ